NGGGSSPVAFDHGQGTGWQRFVIWILREDGAIAALCPVLPPNATMERAEV
ncbi:unnamed protein product, partial [Choristocarpus tenellus]